MNWESLCTAYQVARLGTLSTVAEHLGIHHATAIRQIDQLEQSFGCRLFPPQAEWKILSWLVTHRHLTRTAKVQTPGAALKEARRVDGARLFNRLVECLKSPGIFMARAPGPLRQPDAS